VANEARKQWESVKAAALASSGSLSEGLTKGALQHWHDTGARGLSREARQAFVTSLVGAATVDGALDKLAEDRTYDVLEIEYMRELNAEAALRDLGRFSTHEKHAMSPQAERVLAGGALGAFTGSGIGAMANPSEPGSGALRGAVPGAVLGALSGQATNAGISRATEGAVAAGGLGGLAGLATGGLGGVMLGRHMKTASPTLAGMGLGALAGGAFGAYSDDDNRLRGALRFAVPGATLGAMTGYGIGRVQADKAMQAMEHAQAAREQARKSLHDNMSLLNYTTDTIKKQYGNAQDLHSWLKARGGATGAPVEGQDFHRVGSKSILDHVMDMVNGHRASQVATDAAANAYRPHAAGGPTSVPGTYHAGPDSHGASALTEDPIIMARRTNFNA
jgi:hypothetical protein